MNERIEKLAEQADLLGDCTPTRIDGRYVGYINVADIEKFAELVVKACADAADMAQDAGCKYAGDYVAEYMGFGEAEGVTEWRSK